MSIGELGCPSLNYVYDMSWAEYLIRLYSFNRQRKQRLLEVREIAYASIVGPHQNPKKIPSKEKFMPLEDRKHNEPTELMKERMSKAIEEYHNNVKNRHNG